jgi:phosphopantothenoylcysteine decarboxylase/phosphopantothenate--cysteine ligase
MGHAIADAAVLRGYDVTLVTTADLPVHPAAKVIRVETAEEMLTAVEGVDPEVAIMAAAVADFRPADTADSKIPRAEGLSSIPLAATPDILASVVGRTTAPYTVGFAAETNGLERAKAKAREKGVDLMVYNDVTEPGSGFGTDTNRVVLIDRGGETEELPLLAKAEVAERIMDRVAAAAGGGRG